MPTDLTVTINGNSYQLAHGLTVSDAIQLDKSLDSKNIFAAIVDNSLRELSYQLTGDVDIEPLGMNNEEGLRIYRRSLLFLLIKAIRDLYPQASVIVHHTLSNGLYCEVRNAENLNEAQINALKQQMWNYISRRSPIIKHTFPHEQAIEIFKQAGQPDKVRLLKYRQQPEVHVYELDGCLDYFYGYMLPDVGFLTNFELLPYRNGLLMQTPEADSPDQIKPYLPLPKLGDIFAESEYWAEVLEVAAVGQLNELVASGQGQEILLINEALQEKKVAQIADQFCSRSEARIILISGPSSSGKTTFAQRLAVQLRVNGLKPVSISLDNYFVDRDKTPRDENGDYDFEALEAIDLELFNQHLLLLMAGEAVEIPVFNFHTGQREYQGQTLKVSSNQPIIIEGIHGMNEKLTAQIAAGKKFKIYVSALTQLNLDNHNRIPTTDARIIRRMVRDYQYRGHSARETIRRWPSVRRGENHNIFPYQEQADTMFNSSLVYELAVLKPFVQPLLEQISPEAPEYVTAHRLLKFIEYFLPMSTDGIPPNSILREFVGGTCFEV
ncbi:MAG: nucleoside kinase [Methylocystaceae bacterium]